MGRATLLPQIKFFSCFKMGNCCIKNRSQNNFILEEKRWWYITNLRRNGLLQSNQISINLRQEISYEFQPSDRIIPNSLGALLFHPSSYDKSLWMELIPYLNGDDIGNIFLIIHLIFRRKSFSSQQVFTFLYQEKRSS